VTPATVPRRLSMIVISEVVTEPGSLVLPMVSVSH
jgi:hypothetical protein